MFSNLLVNCKNIYMCITIVNVGVGKFFFNVLKKQKSTLCSPRLDLFDQKYCKTVAYYCKIFDNLKYI